MLSASLRGLKEVCRPVFEPNWEETLISPVTTDGIIAETLTCDRQKEESGWSSGAARAAGIPSACVTTALEKWNLKKPKLKKNNKNIHPILILKVFRFSWGGFWLTQKAVNAQM